MDNTTKFFLGSNSDKGFISYFEQLQEQSDSMQLLILKGGPGSGKSSLMKRIWRYAKEKGHITELIMCASDPDSLDAMIDYTAQFAIVDGTAPHIIDPSLPGAQQHIVYTGDLWDTHKLRENLGRIDFFNGTVKEHHKGATAYIKAASALLSENMSYSKRHINEEKIISFIQKMTRKIPQEEKSIRNVRLISAVSMGEIKFFSETLPYLADTVYVLNDPWGGASDFILKALENAALQKKCEYIVCPCSVMSEKTDHIIVPGAKIAFSLKNSFLKNESGKEIDCSHFYLPMSENLLMERRLSHAQKLLGAACANVKKAKKLHDTLEYMYIGAMDFSKMDGIFENIMKKFYS